MIYNQDFSTIDEEAYFGHETGKMKAKEWKKKKASMSNLVTMVLFSEEKRLLISGNRKGHVALWSY